MHHHSNIKNSGKQRGVARKPDKDKDMDDIYGDDLTTHSCVHFLRTFLA
jgi:hypothetical protein